MKVNFSIRKQKSCFINFLQISFQLYRIFNLVFIELFKLYFWSQMALGSVLAPLLSSCVTSAELPNAQSSDL